MEINEDVAEIVGAHAGDGTLYRTNSNSIVWELRGDVLEKKYYTDHICPLVERAFGIKVNSKLRNCGKSNTWGIQTSKKEITNSFLELGFVPGTKTYTVFVPDYIFNSNIDSKRAFVRGLFDTDGCLNFYAVNGGKSKTYPRIVFNFASKNLRDTLKKLLSEIGFGSYSWDYKTEFAVCLAGVEKLEKWMDEISPMNPKCLKKYNRWKKLCCVK